MLYEFIKRPILACPLLEYPCMQDRSSPSDLYTLGGHQPTAQFRRLPPTITLGWDNYLERRRWGGGRELRRSSRGWSVGGSGRGAACDGELGLGPGLEDGERGGQAHQGPGRVRPLHTE